MFWSPHHSHGSSCVPVLYPLFSQCQQAFPDYMVQGHRFDIIEDIGCQPATYYSIPGVFIVWFPPLLFSSITLIYSSFALYYFFRQRLTFSAVLSASCSSLSTSRYLRLIAMSLTLIVYGSTLTSLIMYENIALGLRPYTSWKDVHSNFSRVDSYRLFEVALGGEGVLRMVWCSWWAMPASALIFFVFFAFGEESLKDMKAGFVWVTSKLGIRSKKKDAEKSGMPFSSVTNSPGYVKNSNEKMDSVSHPSSHPTGLRRPRNTSSCTSFPPVMSAVISKTIKPFLLTHPHPKLPRHTILPLHLRRLLPHQPPPVR